MLESIHLLFVNGQRTDAVQMIQEYGLYDFWSDYLNYLQATYVRTEVHLAYYSDAVISYHRITNR